MKKVILGLVVVAAVSTSSKRAHAQWAVNDLPAITQRALQFVQYVIQFNEMINTARGQFEAFT